ncbi:hypothetical protein JHK86_020504 [Glycine max]|nr:hypothetical protein JHK86_020504 [Glycine max]
MRNALMATTLSFSFPSFQSTPPSTITRHPRRVSISCHSSPSNSNNDPIRVAFSGDGTGSNVYPALAIAEELKTANPTCQFLFLGTPNSVESAAISSAGYDFASVSSPPQNLVFFPQRLLKSLIQCLCHLRDFQPHVVVGTGGYVSFPACIAAKLRGGTNVVIHEPNSVPGFANSLLSFLADAIFVAFNSTLDSFPRNKCLVCGNPVRFMHCMDLAYAAADLIVSRAGAMTCYEISATGKPSILIPSPNFSEGNQFRNASLMADVAGVTVITEDELDSSTLAIAIEKIGDKKMEDMSERALKAANPNASP